MGTARIRTIAIGLTVIVALTAAACVSRPAPGLGSTGPEDITITSTPSGSSGDCVAVNAAKSSGTLTAATQNTPTSFTVMLSLSAPLCEPLLAKAAIYAMPGDGVAWPQSLAVVKAFVLMDEGDTIIEFVKGCDPVQFDVLSGDTPQVIGPGIATHGPLLFSSTALQHWGAENCSPGTTTSTTTTTTTTTSLPQSDLCEAFGKPAQLTMRYLGDSVDSNSQAPGSVVITGDPADVTPVRIIASKESGGAGEVFFDGTVNLGDAFVVDHATMPPPNVVPRTHLTVISPGGVVLQYVEFHTSCSQPLLLGDRYGSVELIGFTNYEGDGSAG